MAEVILVGNVTPEGIAEALGPNAGPVVLLRCTPREARIFGPLLYQPLEASNLYVPAEPQRAGGPTTAFAGLILRPSPERDGS